MKKYKFYFKDNMEKNVIPEYYEGYIKNKKTISIDIPVDFMGLCEEEEIKELKTIDEILEILLEDNQIPVEISEDDENIIMKFPQKKVFYDLIDEHTEIDINSVIKNIFGS